MLVVVARTGDPWGVRRSALNARRKPDLGYGAADLAAAQAHAPSECSQPHPVRGDADMPLGEPLLELVAGDAGTVVGDRQTGRLMLQHEPDLDVPGPRVFDDIGQ